MKLHTDRQTESQTNRRDRIRMTSALVKVIMTFSIYLNLYVMSLCWEMMIDLSHYKYYKIATVPTIHSWLSVRVDVAYRRVDSRMRWTTLSCWWNLTVWPKCWRSLHLRCSLTRTRLQGRTCSTLWGHQRWWLNTFLLSSLACPPNTPCRGSVPLNELLRSGKHRSIFYLVHTAVQGAATWRMERPGCADAWHRRMRSDNDWNKWDGYGKMLHKSWLKLVIMSQEEMISDLWKLVLNTVIFDNVVL